jgi:hypothetical protein
LGALFLQSIVERLLHGLRRDYSRLLSRIPAEHRSETLARIAVATGLFDSAINYAWNAAVIKLRSKVRRFGLSVVPQIIGEPFDEAALLDLKDADLLQLCLEIVLSFLKIPSAWIRVMRQNQRIIRRDACIPSVAWDICRQPVQAAAPA